MKGELFTMSDSDGCKQHRQMEANNDLHLLSEFRKYLLKRVDAGRNEKTRLRIIHKSTVSVMRYIYFKYPINI